MSGIYIITNKINNKSYVGQTNRLHRRLEEHRKALLGNRHHNRHLQSSWNKYGEDAFSFEVLFRCEEDKLNEMEQYAIFSLMTYDENFGYNKNYGGKNSVITGETRLKMSKGHKGMKFSLQHKQNLSKSKMGKNNPVYGKVYTDEEKETRRQKLIGEKSPHYGREFSKEHRQKISMGLYGKNNVRSKRVMCVENGMIFESTRDCVKKMEELLDIKLDNSCIAKVCKGLRSSHKGYTFKYLD